MDDYGRHILLDIPFDHAVGEVSHAFQAEGFDVVSTLDVAGYLARHAQHPHRRYMLLEALMPQLTLQALQYDPAIGPILATTIAIYELADGSTAVSASPALAPVAFDFGWRAGRPAIGALADRANELVVRAIRRLDQFGSAAGVRVPA